LRKLLLDTHVWVWHLLGSDKLPPGIHRLLDSGNAAVWISPISVWEVLMLGQRGRLALKPDPFQWVKAALASSPCAEAPLTAEVALKSREMRLAHEDPADRFIAATAAVYGFELVTCDRRLQAAPGISVVSR